VLQAAAGAPPGHRPQLLDGQSSAARRTISHRIPIEVRKPPPLQDRALAGLHLPRLRGAHKPEPFILARVEFIDDGRHHARYLREPFRRERDFCVTSDNCDLAELLQRAGAPG